MEKLCTLQSHVFFSVFQVRIENLRIVTPFINVSYAVGQKIRLESATDKGSNMSFVWSTNGMSYNLENPEVVYPNIGESTKNLFSLS